LLLQAKAEICAAKPTTGIGTHHGVVNRSHSAAVHYWKVRSVAHMLAISFADIFFDLLRRHNDRDGAASHEIIQGALVPAEKAGEDCLVPELSIWWGSSRIHTGKVSTCPSSRLVGQGAVVSRLLSPLCPLRQMRRSPQHRQHDVPYH
jgi:hypothetical protein